MTKTLLIVVGILSALAGLYALFNPFPATLAATLIAGWALLIVGILQIVAVFRAAGWGGRIWAILVGTISILVGIEILGDPLKGVITLTFAVAVLFVASGLSKLFLSFAMRNFEFRWPVALSGVVSLLLGLMVLRHFPESAAWLLGTLIGIEMLSNGVAALSVAYSGHASEGV